jgi:hypothetical protein
MRTWSKFQKHQKNNLFNFYKNNYEFTGKIYFLY